MTNKDTARQGRMVAAWRGHNAATGHTEGTSGKYDVCCIQCAWYYIDDDSLYALMDNDEGWGEAASTFVRDLDEQAMRYE